ncbi:MAG: sxtJ [Gammaproteobacteria bacterium]|nr:sxtJ [Gammaproteobacteria bacterium]
MTPAMNKSAADIGVLRRFGLTVGAGLSMLFGVLLPWLWDGAYPFWPWLAAGVLVLTGGLKPSWLRPLHRGWMRLALALGWLNTRLLLGVVFYGFMTPLGLILRWAGKDPLTRRFDSKADSYRVAAMPHPDHAHFMRPF